MALSLAPRFVMPCQLERRLLEAEREMARALEEKVMIRTGARARATVRVSVRVRVRTRIGVVNREGTYFYKPTYSASTHSESRR